MKRRHFVLAAACALCTPIVRAAAATSGDDLARTIAARLARVDGVRARFTQTRTLAAMSAPLVSQGDVIVARERGIIWRVVQPYEASFVIGEQGVVEFDATGARLPRRGGSARVAAGASQGAAMARAVANGDLSSLYAQFKVLATGSPERWSVLLTPDQPQLAQAVASVRVEGGAYLQRLRLTAPNGDGTLIVFSDSAPLGRLSDAERAMFEARR